MLELSRDEFDQLRNRAAQELRHPRDTARIIIREAVSTPTRSTQPTMPDDDAQRRPPEPTNVAA
jgi:hypothetical protein